MGPYAFQDKVANAMFHLSRGLIVSSPLIRVFLTSNLDFNIAVEDHELHLSPKTLLPRTT
jgi:hypothetical protein